MESTVLIITNSNIPYFKIIENKGLVYTKHSLNPDVGKLKIEAKKLDCNGIINLKVINDEQGNKIFSGEAVKIIRNKDIFFNEEGLEPEVIETVMNEARCPRQIAIKALRIHYGDPVEALLDIGD